jgi:hypothetical protein
MQPSPLCKPVVCKPGPGQPRSTARPSLPEAHPVGTVGTGATDRPAGSPIAGDVATTNGLRLFLLECSVPTSDAPDRPGPIPFPFDADGGLGFLFADLVRELPEFMPRYLELIEAGDDDPGAPVVLMELAEFVTSRLRVVEIEGSMLTRALGMVEALLDAHDHDDVGAELVRDAFLDTFTVEDRRLLTPRLGPRSLHLLESLERASADDPDW